MPTAKLKCRCQPGYKCSAPLHGEIEIITCEKNCGLGCDKPIEKKVGVPEVKVSQFCQQCKRIIIDKVVELEIRGRMQKLCEDCVQKEEKEEECRDLPFCPICHEPVRDEYAMTTKDSRLIHEECYEGEDG